MARLPGVLRDVDSSIEAWLHALLPDDVTVSFGPPSDRELPHPTLALHLHSVRQDPECAGGWEELRDSDGVLAGRLPPDRRYRIVYLATAWAAEVAQEHELLGRFLLGAAGTPVLPDEYLRGCLVDETRAIPMHVAPTEPAADPAALWAAWRIPPRAVVDFALLVPLPRVPITELAPPPSGIDLRSERRGPAQFDNGPNRPGAAPRRRPAVNR